MRVRRAARAGAAETIGVKADSKWVHGQGAMRAGSTRMRLDRGRGVVERGLGKGVSEREVEGGGWRWGGGGV